jgi:hypothetical protein
MVVEVIRPDILVSARIPLSPGDKAIRLDRHGPRCGPRDDMALNLRDAETKSSGAKGQVFTPEQG